MCLYLIQKLASLLITVVPQTCWKLGLAKVSLEKEKKKNPVTQSEIGKPN